MEWHPITDRPDHAGATYVIYSPELAADQQWPGHPIMVSNPEYIRSGNAQKDGYAFWLRLPEPPK